MTTDLGNRAVKQLMVYAEQGTLPLCYNDSVKEWLYDFWPDLSWNAELSEDIKTILEAPEFPRIKEFFQTRYNFDFEEELRSGLEPEE